MIRLAVLLIAALAACSPARSADSAKLVEVARNLEVPWSLAWDSEGRMFITERPGRVRVGSVVTTIPNVTARAETGLMGLALHPDFAKNRFVYVCYATQLEGGLGDVVMRFRENGGRLESPQTILTNIPAARFHAGCELKFGPDRKLYITTGDATEPSIAQELKSLGGKILRINDDGSVPSDNPWPNSPVWSYGHRNPQGIDWDANGTLWSTEHGPSGMDGGTGGDEVNIIEKGKNYGWPVIHHDERRAGMLTPLREYSPAHAPASAAFWRGDFYFGCLRGEHLHRLVIDPKDRRKVLREERLYSELGRIREVAVGPDGALYFATSNRDGRGNPEKTDDRIFKISP